MFQCMSNLLLLHPEELWIGIILLHHSDHSTQAKDFEALPNQRKRILPIVLKNHKEGYCVTVFGLSSNLLLEYV